MTQRIDTKLGMLNVTQHWFDRDME